MVLMKTGVLLINLGSPDAPRPREVRRYLKQFLSDPRVLDIPALARWLLLHLIILPFRPRRAAAAYAQVWMAEGSPLLVHSRALAQRVAALLGESYAVEVAMRYGRPSFEQALNALVAKGCQSIVAVPLYPQYASSSTGTALEELYRVAGKLWNTPVLQVIPPFFDDPGFIASQAAVCKEAWGSAGAPEHVLFSFHGLPERHITKCDESLSHCLKTQDCCERQGAELAWCYQAQCYRTAGLLAQTLKLGEGRWSVSFQSRLGRTPWIQPFTDVVIPQFVHKGVRSMAVVCPSFTADCLETLEEIGIRARKSFIEAGGKGFQFIPCVNDHPRWAAVVSQWVKSNQRSEDRLKAFSEAGLP